LLLLQVPPPTLLSVVVEPAHTLAAPDIGEGSALIVIAVLLEQPVGSVYIALTGATEVATRPPVVGSMVAAKLLLVLQVPPAVAFVRIVEEPRQTLVVPPIAAGSELIVIGLIAVQPFGSV
jgi:hypothetical protein